MEVRTVLGNVVNLDSEDIIEVKRYRQLSNKVKEAVNRKFKNEGVNESPADCYYVFARVNGKKAMMIVDKEIGKVLMKIRREKANKFKRKLYERVYGGRGLVDPDEALFRKGLEFDWRR